MVRADMLVPHPFRLFGGIVENALALLAQRNLDGSGNPFTNGDTRLNFLANGFDGAVGAQKTIRQNFVFAQEPKQQMRRLDVRTAVLAGLVPREKDHSPSLL